MSHDSAEDVEVDLVLETLRRPWGYDLRRFFCDENFFHPLKEVLPHLATFPRLNIWHAGCAIGEEVYSLAILLHDAGLLARATIYATDLDPRLLGLGGSDTSNTCLGSRVWVPLGSHHCLWRRRRDGRSAAS